MLTQFHEKAQKAIVIAESIAFDLGHSSVGSEHLLLSLLKMKDCQFSKLMKNYHVDDEMIYEDIVRLFGKKDIQPFYMEYSEIIKKILEDAMNMSEAKGDTKVSLNTLCIAMLIQKECVAIELLNKYHVCFDQIKKELSDEESFMHELDSIHELTNLNKRVKKQERLMIGRQKELEQLFLTLCKKEKNNALLIGKAGVGKTALVEKLAIAINEKKVPNALKKKVVYELSLSHLVAGTKYRGEFEEKFKKIIDKVIQAKNVILFIDEIHNLIGAGGAEGAIDASNILKPYLARKDLTIIGATTIEEYYKYFEKDQAMNRRFAVVTLNENTKEETKEILMGLRKQYGDYHHIEIDEQCIDDIIQLCDQYLIQRVFPDKAIDVLDLACVKAGFLSQQKLNRECIEAVIEEMSGVKLHHDFSYEIVLENLKKEIIGQDQALRQMVESMHSLALYPHENKPEGIYLLMGSSGIGKTQTAKVLSQLLGRHLIKVDMSEYSDAMSVNKIIGSAPGYVGYDDQSAFINDMVLYPHSIVLLDEIEKAHPQVLNLFLQVFDEGILKDNHHHVINFKDTMIIMTSNVMSQNQANVGFKHHDISMDCLKEYFSEAFLNRIDEMIPYKLLSKNDLGEIIKKNAPVEITDVMVDDILRDYDVRLGARFVLTKMKKYLVSHSV